MERHANTSDINFFMAGCPRCGTTWVHMALKDHPQIYLPSRKQTYFFDVNYEKGIDWYLESYRRIEDCHKAVGEISTGYSLPHALPRLAEHFPHARIMLAMRDPAERAYSFFQSRAVSAGWENIREATAAKPTILDQGRYIEHVERIYEHFPPDRVLLLFYDDLKIDDRAYLRQILEFLGVDPSHESSQLGRIVQVAAFPRTRRLLRRMKLGPVLDQISRSVIGDYLRKSLKSSTRPRYPAMDAATRAYLYDYYKPFNDRLAQLTGRDLSSWNG